jgi:hypothetical protein
LCHEERFKRQQQIAFGCSLYMYPKSGANQPQRIFRTKLGAYKMCGDDRIGIQPINQPTHYGGFPGTYLSGDNDKALTAHNAVLKIRACALMLLATEIETWIGTKLKGFAPQPIERFVHGLKTMGYGSNDR